MWYLQMVLALTGLHVLPVCLQTTEEPFPGDQPQARLLRVVCPSDASRRLASLSLGTCTVGRIRGVVSKSWISAVPEALL